MGRLTYLSLPEAHRPLKRRINIVVSRTMASSDQENLIVVRSFDEALQVAASKYPDKLVYVMGGGQLYEAALDHPHCERILLTRVLADIPCTVFMPIINESKFELKEFSSVQHSTSEGNLPYMMLTYVKRHEEWQYLDLLKLVLRAGNEKMDRTQVGTMSKFGCTMKFSLLGGVMPLLSTKQVFFRGIVQELLWMLRGSTDSKILSAKRVKIWDKDGELTGGDLGPVYGHQWRHFGATYINCNTNYEGKGVDQISNLIHDIRTTPESRRMIVCAWNPQDLDKMALPPCHVLFHVYVHNKKLHSLLYQRSGLS
jgi:dihydrofolate reductase/thymidylate synthase